MRSRLKSQIFEPATILSTHIAAGPKPAGSTKLQERPDGQRLDQTVKGADVKFSQWIVRHGFGIAGEPDLVKFFIALAFAVIGEFICSSAALWRI